MSLAAAEDERKEITHVCDRKFIEKKERVCLLICQLGASDRPVTACAMRGALVNTLLALTSL
jgi:hypothetical protein